MNRIPLTLLCVAFVSPVFAQDPTINELRIDQPSSDLDEYFELAGPAGTSLNDLTYIVIGDGTGGSGVIEAVVSLAGWTIGSTGYFVAAESTFTLGTADLTTTLDFENSDNVTHLLVRDFTGSKNDDLDTDDDGILDSTPWSAVVSGIALIEDPTGGDKVYWSVQVGPDGSFVPAHPFVCAGTWVMGDFDPTADGSDTPGADNACGGGADFQTYCVAFPNSAFNDGARMGWTGSGSIAANDTVITVSQCPNRYGMFFFGSSPDLIIPFGNGALCVGGSLWRLLPVSKAVGNANSYTLDFTGSGPDGGIVSGDTRYFQYWFRDPGQGAGSNTSDGLQVTFAN
jgi:hypothetical protein